MIDDELYQLAKRVGGTLLQRRLMLVIAESCTGGWVGEAITSVAGSSDWFDRGFITYSDHAKREMLAVGEQTLAQFGAVSEETAAEMAAGALRASRADLAVAVTGVAGPGGGTAAKPVGTVCFAWMIKNAAPVTQVHQLPGDRTAVRRQAVILALQGLLRLV